MTILVGDTFLICLLRRAQLSHELGGHVLALTITPGAASPEPGAGTVHR
ncbi:hypothetical protein A2U01_0098106, partial [Trifolium medium]|nr:hypothetical protein [Trifolium medium]